MLNPPDSLECRSCGRDVEYGKYCSECGSYCSDSAVERVRQFLREHNGHEVAEGKILGNVWGDAIRATEQELRELSDRVWFLDG